MSTTTLPFEWLKEVPTALLQLDDIPLLGFPPVFPWAEFSEKLAQTFQVSNIEIKPLETKWRDSSDIFAGLGQDLIPIHFQVPSLEGDICAIFAKRDIELIMSELLAKQKEPLDIIDKEFQDGFIHFLAYEVIYIFNQCNFDKSLNPHVAEKKENSDEELKEMLLQRENTLCQDISFSIEDSTFIIRLLISNTFRKSWKEKYAARSLEIPLKSDLAKKIHIPVCIEAGKTSLKLSEWKQISVGDFLLLDFCSLDPENDKGRIMLTVNGNRFFKAKLKDGSIKILEHPLFYEENITPETLKPIAKSEVENMANEKEPNDEISELEDDFTFEDLQSEQEPEKEPEHDENEKPTEKLEDEEIKEKGDQIQAANEKFIADEIMLDVIVEVGRIQMSIQKLTELQPGNILEIDVRPENGVDLVVNGKRIGKGELLKLGEVIGVRILDV